MRNIFVILSFIGFSGCSTLPHDSFDQRYSRSEVASLAANHFEVSSTDAHATLRPALKKYGPPHAYIDGLMSSVDDVEKSHLYGSGFFQTKLHLNQHTFWLIDGEGLAGHLDPIKTAHIVYDIVKLDPLQKSFEFRESLTKRGQKFSIFEHKVDDKVIITFHKTDDLEDTRLDKLRFYRE